MELGALAPFSSMGLALDGGSRPPIAAPGVGLVTSVPGRNEGGAARYGTISGSSAAAALVTGGCSPGRRCAAGSRCRRPARSARHDRSPRPRRVGGPARRSAGRLVGRARRRPAGRPPRCDPPRAARPLGPRDRAQRLATHVGRADAARGRPRRASPSESHPRRFALRAGGTRVVALIDPGARAARASGCARGHRPRGRRPRHPAAHPVERRRPGLRGRRS